MLSPSESNEKGYLVLGVAPGAPDRQDSCVAGQDLLHLTPSFRYHVIVDITRHCDIYDHQGRQQDNGVRSNLVWGNEKKKQREEK